MVYNRNRTNVQKSRRPLWFPRLRARLALRHRLRDRVEVKHSAQLQWWLQEWDPVIRAGGLNPGDALEFIADEAPDPTYWGRRWQLARSQVARVVNEAELGDAGYFAGKVVVEVGPGPIGFPDACPARVSIGIDPLAEGYAQADLLPLPDSGAIYVPASAERLPLTTAAADVVLARDTLDYVDDPEQVLAELRRVLRPGGRMIPMFDVGHVPNPAQPNSLTPERVKAQLVGMTVVGERRWPEPFGADGHRALLVADAPARYDRPADERKRSGSSTYRPGSP